MIRFSSGCLVLALVLSVCFSCRVDAQLLEESDIPSPLLDETPFDLIYLDKASENAIIQIKPIPDIKKPLGDIGTLRFEYLVGSNFVLQVPRENVERYVTFNELLLKEADQFISENNFAAALRNLLYVYDHGKRDDFELKNRMQELIFKDAVANYQSGRLDLALSIFSDLHKKNPGLKIEGLPGSVLDALLKCYDGILEKRFELADAEYVKNRLDQIKLKYPNGSEEFLAKWNGRFKEQWQEAMDAARKEVAAGNGREAHKLSRKAERILEGQPETRELQEQITRKYPLIVVGVNQPGVNATPTSLNWSKRRVGRLTQRTLMEITGLGDEGGLYEFVNGSFERVDDLGLEYMFTLKPPAELSPTTPPLRASQLSTLLLSHASAGSPNYSPAWAKILASVTVQSDTQVKINLRKPFIRPAAIPRFPYEARDPETGQALQNGPYIKTGSFGDEVTFEVNPAYPRIDEKQNPVIIEKNYESTSAAVDALIRGQVDIIDRPALADLEKLQQSKGIEVRSYSIPTVHFLVPKIRGDYAGSVDLVQAMSVAIDRDLIVKRVFGAGEDSDGSIALSGPFPLGTDDNDQVSYGFNQRVKPLQTEQNLALVLAKLAQTTPTREFKNGRPNPPTIILVHPSSSNATRAAVNIAQAWNVAGINTKLRRLSDNATQPEDDNWDVLYVEVAVEEPLTDANRLMGTNGLAKIVSPPVENMLQKLGTTTRFRDGSRILRKIHRQVATIQFEAAPATLERAWEARPYQVAVWLCLDGSPLLGGDAEQLCESVETQCHLFDASGWNVRVGTPPSQWRWKLLEYSSEQAISKDLLSEPELAHYDKLMVVRLRESFGSISIKVREYDIQTQQHGPVTESSTRFPGSIPLITADLVTRAFMPLARIDVVNAANQAFLKSRGIQACVRTVINEELVPEVEPIRSSPVFVRSSDRFQPVVVRTDRAGKITKLDAIPFTFIVADSINQNSIQGTIHSSQRAPLAGRKSKRAQKLALVIRPPEGNTTLRLMSRGKDPLPLEGYEILSRPPGATKEDKSEFLGKTDWRGEIVIPQSRDLRLLLVKRGSRPLKKIPVIPGFRDFLETSVASDDKRLEAEGVVLGLQQELKGQVAVRSLYELQILGFLERGEKEQAKEVLELYLSLETPREFKQRLANEESSLKSQTESKREKEAIRLKFEQIRKIVGTGVLKARGQDLEKMVRSGKVVPFRDEVEKPSEDEPTAEEPAAQEAASEEPPQNQDAG